MAVLFLLAQPDVDRLQETSLAFARQEFGVVFLSGAAEMGATFAQGPPALLLADADLPDFRDLNVLASLRKSPGWEKIPILITGTADRSVEAKRFGASDFVPKPLVPDKLFEKVAGLLSSPTRRYPRKSVSGPCLIVSGGKRYEARLMDVSISGIRAKMEGTLPAGSLVQLSFGLPTGANPYIVRCKGKVARAIPGGYGFAFSAMDPNDRGVLYSFTRTT